MLICLQKAIGMARSVYGAADHLCKVVSGSRQSEPDIPLQGRIPPQSRLGLKSRATTGIKSFALQQCHTRYNPACGRPESSALHAISQCLPRSVRLHASR